MPPRQKLEVREGARYACAGDGLCCSDVHALGPVTRAERARVLAIDPDALEDHPRLALPVFKTRADHACRFFDGDRGCRIHREHGADAKPQACRQFPFGLVRTPEGLRVTTAHRCPCRTIGARPPLDPEEARAALTVRGRLRVNQEVGARVAIARRRRASFAAYRALEAPLLARLFGGLALEMARDTGPLPELLEMHYADLAHEYRAMVDGTTTGEALAWFGDALLSMLGERRVGTRPRPWRWAFDRAERRSDGTRTRADLYADFAADAIYGLRWAEEGSLARVLAALSVGLRAADAVTTALVKKGVGEERAAGEAIVVVEVGLAGAMSYARFTDDAEAAALAGAGIAPLKARPAATRRSALPS